MNVKFSCRHYRSLVQHIPTPLKRYLQSISKTSCIILLLLTVPFGHAAEVEDFIPKDIIWYLKIQDMDEVYGEIEISENWEKVLTLLPDLSNWQEMQQGLAMFQGMLGTNLQEVIETVGYRTALTFWFDEEQEGLLQLGLVIHSGGNLGKLQQLTKIAEGLLGMSDANTLHLNAGVYRGVRYNALKIDDDIVRYGFVDDFFVLGVGEGSFETLLDVYRTDTPDIQENEEFNSALKKVGYGEVIVLVHIDYAYMMLTGSHVWIQTQLPIFPLLFGRINLLETAPLFHLAVQFKPDAALDQDIRMFMKEKERLETLNALSGKEDLFVAVAPQILEGVWELVRILIAENPEDDDIDTGIAFVEGLLNLDLEEDLMAGLTGELALSVPDLTHFDPEALRSIRAEFDGIFELDAGDVETNGGIIFRPSNRLKWNLIGNSLSNLQSASVSQTDYKGVTVSGFASNIYYSEIDGLFLIGFAEDQVFTLIDEIREKKEPVYLKQLPKTPTAFAQLNLAQALKRENGSPPADKLIVDAKEIPPLLAWLSVENDMALLEVTLSEKETPIETLAKLVPFLLWNMEAQWELSD